MSELNEDDLAKLTKLCRIETTEEERKKFLHSLKNVLKYIDQLQKVDTEGVPTCNYVIETSCNVTREDIVHETLPRSEFLANAPSHIGGMIKVPSVMKAGAS